MLETLNGNSIARFKQSIVVRINNIFLIFKYKYTLMMYYDFLNRYIL